MKKPTKLNGDPLLRTSKSMLMSLQMNQDKKWGDVDAIKVRERDRMEI